MVPARPALHFVILCDWLGKCSWVSSANYAVVKGEFIWDHLVGESQEELKVMLALAVVYGESRQVEIVAKLGGRFRCQLSSMALSDRAVCMLAFAIPAEISRITLRERGCLELLAQGIQTKRIAIELDVSVSTVQTHLNRSRKKLDLATSEALASYAARYFYPSDGLFVPELN